MKIMHAALYVCKPAKRMWSAQISHILFVSYLLANTALHNAINVPSPTWNNPKDITEMSLDAKWI